MRLLRDFIRWWKSRLDDAAVAELDRDSEFPPSLEGITWGVGIDR
jgi:hypothetical protein